MQLDPSRGLPWGERERTQHLRFSVENPLIDRKDCVVGVQQPDDDLLAELRRQRRDPQVDPPALETETAAAILRLAALGDVHAGNDLETRDGLVLKMVRNSQHFPQKAVNTLSYLNGGLLWLDVDIAGSCLGCVAQDEVDEPDNGWQVRVLDQQAGSTRCYPDGVASPRRRIQVRDQVERAKTAATERHETSLPRPLGDATATTFLRPNSTSGARSSSDCTARRRRCLGRSG